MATLVILKANTRGQFLVANTAGIFNKWVNRGDLQDVPNMNAISMGLDGLVAKYNAGVLKSVSGVIVLLNIKIVFNNTHLLLW